MNGSYYSIITDHSKKEIKRNHERNLRKCKKIMMVA